MSRRVELKNRISSAILGLEIIKIFSKINKMTEVEKNLLNQMIQQMSILHSHSSNVVQRQDLERAVQNHWFLQNLVLNWNLDSPSSSVDLAKKLAKSYPQYTFSSGALKYIENFMNMYHQKYPNKKSLLVSMPLYQKEIDKIYSSTPTSSMETFDPKEIEIDLESNLYHTTNAFDIFDTKSS